MVNEREHKKLIVYNKTNILMPMV